MSDDKIPKFIKSELIALNEHIDPSEFVFRDYKITMVEMLGSGHCVLTLELVEKQESKQESKQENERQKTNVRPTKKERQ